MHFNPDYLIEKFDRYIRSTVNESDFGLHPSLRRSLFEPYCDKYKIPYSEFEEIE